MRIRMICGSYGYRSNGVMESKDARSGSFEVDGEEGLRLVEMGYAVQEESLGDGELSGDGTGPGSGDTQEGTEKTGIHTAGQLMDMNKRELEKLAKDMGIASYGTKEELVKRIMTEQNRRDRWGSRIW